MNAVGVDVGGTKIAAGVVSPEGGLLNEVRCPTANARERLLSTIAEAITEVKRGAEVGGVCLAVPGFILASENKVLSAANLEAIEGIPLKVELGSRTGLPSLLRTTPTRRLGVSSALAWAKTSTTCSS
jgi:glucokinase